MFLDFRKVQFYEKSLPPPTHPHFRQFLSLRQTWGGGGLVDYLLKF
jgi:hypothetical protein